ncbi:MAG: hypothetical protein AB1490_18840 [Pseudomonadota bacterium]
MSDFAIGRRQARPVHRMLVLAAIGAGVILTAAPVAYMLWPQAVPVAPDAPSLPIQIGGVTFNVPPAAIRVPVQRRPGTQGRIDLMFLWPSLTPPDLTTKATPAAPPNLSERIFVTIAASDGSLPPVERLKTIYPRYAAGAAVTGSDGLSVTNFKAGSPYHGEELIADPSAPERFLLRCTRRTGAAPGMCLHERRIMTADVTVRFPRDWLTDWRAVADGIDKLLGSLRPHGG